MRERLQRAWGERVHRARQWQRDEDPTPVLEALGHVVVWHLLGELGAIDQGERRALGEIAGSALTAAREHALASEDDGTEWHDVIALADLGRRLLGGHDPGDLADVPADMRRPTPRRIASMLDGRLDGLSAAACAVWCLNNDTSEPRILWAMGQPPQSDTSPEESILVAAADPEPMRAPETGQVVATHQQAGVEAVWFPGDRELALYAEQDIYVSLSAKGATMRDVRPGYWIGTVDPNTSELDAELKVGEQVWQWRLPLA